MATHGPHAERWAALDNLRGLTVFLMVPVNAGMELSAIPAWFKHAPGAGLTLVDLIVPAFLFALGVSSSFSLQRRLADRGLLKTILLALRRYGLLFLFGTIGYVAVHGLRNWEILQMLGLAGAIAFPFLFLPPAWRAVSAVALVGLVEVLRDRAGPRRAAPATVVGSAAVVVGLGLAWIIPVDKHLLSTSYLLLTFGAAAMGLAALTLVERVQAGDIPPLGALGRNPLLGYMLGGILTLAVRAWVPAEAPAPAAWAASLGTLALVTAVALMLDARRVYVRL